MKWIGPGVRDYVLTSHSHRHHSIMNSVRRYRTLFLYTDFGYFSGCVCVLLVSHQIHVLLKTRTDMCHVSYVSVCLSVEDAALWVDNTQVEATVVCFM